MDNKIAEILKEPSKDAGHEDGKVILDENNSTLPDCCKYTELANYDQWEVGLQNHNGPSHYVERMKEVLATQREWERGVRLPMITEMREQWLKMQKEQNVYDKLEVDSDGDDNKITSDHSLKTSFISRRSKKRKNSPSNDEDNSDSVDFSKTTDQLKDDINTPKCNSEDKIVDDKLAVNISDKSSNEQEQGKRLNDAKRCFDRLKRRYEVAEQKQTSWLMDQLGEIKQSQCN